MRASAAVTLRRGLEADGAWQRAAELRPLGDDEEARLVDADDLLPVERATLLLALAVERVGSVEPFGPDEARALSTGDRNSLLLHLHRLSVGERVDATLSCPNEGCGEPLELTPLVDELLAPPARAAAPERAQVELSDGRRVWVRPATGADLEAAAVIGAADPDGALALVLDRCVDPGRTQLDQAGREAIEAAMRELDSEAELVLSGDCPACGRAFAASLDPVGILWELLARRARERHREIHLLALNYHWTEQEILAIGPARRRIYLDLLEGGPA